MARENRGSAGAAPGGAAFEAVRDLMSDDRFIALRRKADQGIFLWPDMRRERMPEGYSDEQAWELLTLVRRQTAVQLPWNAFCTKKRNGRSWFSNSRALTERLARLDATMADGAALSASLLRHRGAVEVQAWGGRDVEAALAADGAVGSAPGEREALLGNLAGVLAESDAYAASPLTPATVRDIHQRLARGTEGLQLAPGRRFVSIDPTTRYDERDYTLHVICQMASGELSGREFHPALRVINICWLMLSARPFPSLNALTELAVRRVCLRRLGFQALSLVPLLRMNLDWASGTRPIQRGFSEFMDDVDHYFCDYTPFFLLTLEMMLEGVDGLEKTVEDLERREADIDDALIDAHLNHRQRAIVLNAINEPDRPQRIDAHRKLYRVAYATARKDFLDLVEAGYLRQAVEGRAFSFYPSRRLVDSLKGA